MEKAIPEDLPAIILIGELKEGTPAWNLPFDPTYSYTDGSFRSLFMRLHRIITSEDFQFDKVYDLGSIGEVYLTSQSVFENSLIYCVLSIDLKFDDKLISAINKIVERGGVYTAKKFYYEVKDVINTSEEIIQIESLLPEEVYKYMSNQKWEDISIKEIASLLIFMTSDPNSVKGDKLMDFTLHMLSLIDESIEVDIILDSAFVIALRYLENQSFDNALTLFGKISYYAALAERLALEISCRIRSARIAKLYAYDDPMNILDHLAPIDDGSLEVASQNDREEYYCLQGFAYSLLGDMETAEDLYLMSILISEAESFPTMNKAEAHAFLGLRAGEKFNPEIATQELITAASIANRNSLVEMAKFYSHLAAYQEIKWSKYLATSAIILKMETNFDEAKYKSWQALKRLINSFNHSDRELRAIDLVPESDEIIRMTKSILSTENDEFALQTMNELEENFKNIMENSLSPEFEIELYKFLSAKISTMIPLPSPIIMLIANDGRLITGGEIGMENWDDAISDSDELFSGVLSAIMTVLTEVIASKTPLRMVDAGTTQIMLEKSKVCIGAVLIDRDLIAVRRALKKVVEMMETDYPSLRDWDGYSLDFSGLKPKIDEIFALAMKEISN